MKTSAILLSVLIFFNAFISCKKNPDTPNATANQPLVPFTVKVVERVTSRAIIEWTESVNLNNSDTVKYKVYLNNVLVDSNLVKRIDTLINLSATLTYTGKVFAYTASGDTASAPFFLERADGMVLFGREDGGSVNNSFQANNLYSGTTLFKTPFGSPGMYTVPEFSCPTISNDTAFISNNRSNEFSLEAFNLNTGALIWKSLPYSGGFNTLIQSDITYYQGKLYASTRDGVIAINASNGETLWRNTNYIFDSNPIVYEDKLLVNTGGNLYALNLATGTPIWHTAHVDLLSARPVVNNNLIYFTTRGQSVYALDKNTGTIVWSKNYVGINGYYDPIPPPLIYKNILIIGTTELGIYGLDLISGETIWNYNNGIMGCTPPALGNGLRYFSQTIGFTNYQTQISAVNAETGQLVWEKTNSNQYTVNLIFAGNRIYCEHYATIECIDALSGSPLQSIYNGSDLGPFSIRLNSAAYYSSTHGNYNYE